MAYVSYNGKKIVPAPFAATTYSVQRNAAQRLVGRFTIQLEGKLVAFKGSPDSDGVFWTSSGYPPDETVVADSRLAAILAKQSALRTLFADDHKTLEIQADDGSAPRKFTVALKGDINFAKGNWFDTCEYTIALEGFDQAVTETALVESATDSWNMESLDEKLGTYRLTHSVSAKGVASHDETGALVASAWENARDYVLNTLTLGLRPARMVADGVLDGDDLQAFNYLRSQQIDEQEGSFAVTETWVCFDPGDGAAATEEFNVQGRRAQDGRITVTVEGTVTGLEKRHDTTRALVSTRFTNAQTKWEDDIQPILFTRAQNITGYTLNPLVVQYQVGFNEVGGVITYNYEYDNRPASNIVGALSESITVSNHHPGDIFASIPVLGRAYGPVLQAIGTYTARKRSVQMEIMMPPAAYGYTPTIPSTNDLVATFIPPGTQVFMDSDEENYNYQSGKYSRSTSWTWEAP